MTLSGIPAVFHSKKNFLRTAVSNLSLPGVLSAFFVAALGVGAEKFRGYQDNTDFAKHLFALLGKTK